MYRVEFYAAVRRSVYVEGLSERAAARRFGLARETVRKMLRYRLPPGYRRAQPIRRPKLDAFTGVIDVPAGCFRVQPLFYPSKASISQIVSVIPNAIAGVMSKVPCSRQKL